MRESAFWNNTVKRFPGSWQRVECILPDGFPDCLVVLEGRTFFVELKSVDTVAQLATEVSAAQALWHRRHQEAGGESYVLAYVARLAGYRWFLSARSLRQGVFDTCPGPYHGRPS